MFYVIGPCAPNGRHICSPQPDLSKTCLIKAVRLASSMYAVDELETEARVVMLLVAIQ